MAEQKDTMSQGSCVLDRLGQPQLAEEMAACIAALARRLKEEAGDDVEARERLGMEMAHLIAEKRLVPKIVEMPLTTHQVADLMEDACIYLLGSRLRAFPGECFDAHRYLMTAIAAGLAEPRDPHPNLSNFDGDSDDDGEEFAVDAAERLWNEHQGATELPEGVIGLSYDIEGAEPSILFVSQMALAEALQGMAAIVAANAIPFGFVVQSIADEYVRYQQAGDDEAHEWMAWSALWTIVHHPEHGETLRVALSEALRRHGRTHITWRFASGGLSIGLGKRPMPNLPPRECIIDDDLLNSTPAN